MFNRNKNGKKEIIVDDIVYHKLCVLLEEEGHENFSKLIQELLNK